MKRSDRDLLLEALAIVKAYEPRTRLNVARKNKVLFALSRRLNEKPSFFRRLAGRW